MKDRYIKMRNEKIIDWQLIYDYVLSKGFTLGVERFNLGGPHLMTVMNKIFDQLDSEYELTILYDNKGNFIKVIT
jgi:hypothetical protein